MCFESGCPELKTFVEVMNDWLEANTKLRTGRTLSSSLAHAASVYFDVRGAEESLAVYVVTHTSCTAHHSLAHADQQSAPHVCPTHIHSYNKRYGVKATLRQQASPSAVRRTSGSGDNALTGASSSSSQIRLSTLQAFNDIWPMSRATGDDIDTAQFSRAKKCVLKELQRIFNMKGGSRTKGEFASAAGACACLNAHDAARHGCGL